MKKFSVIFIQIFYKKHKHYFLKKYFLRRKILFTFKEASKILILLGILGYGYGYYPTLPVPKNFRVPYLKSRVTGKVGYGYYPRVP